MNTKAYKPTFGNVMKDLGLSYANYSASMLGMGSLVDNDKIQNPFLRKASNVADVAMPAITSLAANIAMPGVGGAVATGLQTLGSSIAGTVANNDPTSTATLDAPMFALGGNIIQSYQGANSHANGGALVDKLGNPAKQSGLKGIAEVEKDEYSHNGYVFSNQLSPDKNSPTYAKQFKSLAKKYGYNFKDKTFKRPGDSISQNEFNAKAEELKQAQDSYKLSQGLATIDEQGNVVDIPKYATGGDLTNQRIIPYNPGQLSNINTQDTRSQLERDKADPNSYINKATGAVKLSPVNIQDVILLPYGGYKVASSLKNLKLATTPNYINGMPFVHPRVVRRAEAVRNAAIGSLGAQATTTGLDSFAYGGGIPQMAKGGEIPPQLLKEQNPYLVPEYTQPMVGNTILPDPKRPMIPGTQMSEYKMGINMDNQDYSIPTVVGGQYLGTEGAIDRFRATGESFKNTANPQSYSKFYDEVDKIGIMKLADGGGIPPYKSGLITDPFNNDYVTMNDNPYLEVPQITKLQSLNKGLNITIPERTVPTTVAAPAVNLNTSIAPTQTTSNSILGDIPMSAKIGAGVQGAATLANAIYAATRKPNKTTPQLYNPQELNLEGQRVGIRNEADLARNIVLGQSRGASNLADSLNIARSGLAGVNREAGQRLDQSYLTEATTNTQLNNEAQIRNLAEKARVEGLNQAEQDALVNLRMNAINNIGTTAGSISRDLLAYQSEAEKAKYLGSANYKNIKVNGVNSKAALSNRTTLNGLPVYILEDGTKVDSFGKVLQDADLTPLEK